MKKFFYTLIIIMLPLFLTAQKGGKVELFGRTEDATNNRKMGGVDIEIYKDGTLSTTVSSASNGKYETIIPIGAEYKIVYKKPGYVSKFLTIDLRNIKQEDFGKYNLPMELDMTLFLEVPEVDFSLLENKPIGKADWDVQAGSVTWDWDYTNKMKKKVEEIQDAAEKKQEEENENKEKFKELMAQGAESLDNKRYNRSLEAYKEANEVYPEGEGAEEKITEVQKLIKEQKEKKEKYANLIQQGDRQFNNKEYEKALQSFNDALMLKPDEEYPSEQIIKIEEKLAKLKEEKEEAAAKEKKYNNLITAADNLLDQKEYENSIKKYEEALNIKPDETYPKKQISKAEGLIEKRKNAKENKAEYEKLIEQADKKLDNKEYKIALAKYQKASTLISEKQYPKDKVEEINKILEKQAKKEELNRKYTAAIDKADQFMTQEEYESAKTQYNKALELKPNESYPKQKLEEIKKLIKEQAALEEEQAKYDGFIEKADTKFNSEEWDPAKINYNRALEVFPEKSYPKEQIQKIEEKLKEIEEEKEKEEKFKALVASADQLFDQEKWEEAKSKYKEALTIKSTATHPKARVSEINEKLRSLANKNELKEKYNNLITQADQFYQAENYEKSKKQYQDALEVKPNESYPKTQIKAIEDAIERREQEKLDKKYRNLVSSADEAFDAEDFELAKNKYEEALELKPEENYPQNKIKAIEDLLSEKKKKKEKANEQEEEYNALIDKADQFFTKENWNKSIEKYKEALEVMPNESHPKARIEEANQKIKAREEEKALEANYQTEIDKADNAFDNENYEESKNLYKKAAQIKPSETYPQEQIDEINKLMKEETNTEVSSQYQKIIEKADNSFDSEDYDNAESYYNRALKIKPDDQHPQDRLDEIAQIRANQKNEKKDKKYQKVIQEADAMYEQKEWERAKELYKKAFGIKKDPYPQDQIDKINAAMETETNKEVSKQYQKIIDKADGLFDNEEYEDARSYYVRATEIKPNDSHPKVRVNEIDKLLAMEQQKNKEVAMEDYGKAAEGQSIQDGEALLQEAEMARRHDARLEVKKQGEEQTDNQRQWSSQGQEQTSNMRDSSEMMRGKITENKEDLGEVREKNEYEVGEYQDKRSENTSELKRYDETEMLKTRKQSRILSEKASKARVADDEMRKENVQKVNKNAEKIGTQKEATQSESYDASYDSRVKAEKTRADITDNNKESDKIRQQNELDVTAFDENLKKTNAEESSESYDKSMDMRSSTEETRTTITENNKGSNQKRIDNSEELIVYDDDRTSKTRERRSDDYDEAVSTQMSAEELQTDMKENRKEGDKNRQRNSEEVVKEKDFQKKKKGDEVQESYSQITEVRDQTESMRTKITENNKDSDQTRKNNSSDVEDYQDENAKKHKNQNEEQENNTQQTRADSEEMRDKITENKKEMGELIDKNDEEIKELEKKTNDRKSKSDQGAKDRQNSSLDLMNDEYKNYDPSEHNGEMANALAEKYPEGVTEKSYNVKDEKGRVKKVITRRVVVKGYRGDVYERIQSRFGLSYFMNGEAISEHVWQSNTSDARLTRHTDKNVEKNDK